MATTFEKSSEWFLDLWDPAYVDGGANPPGATYYAPSGKTWKRHEWVAVLHRSGATLVSHWPETGNSIDGGSIEYSHGTDTKHLGTGYTYTCEQDILIPTPPGSGMYDHRRVYVYRSGWGLVDVPVSPDPPTEAE